MVVSNHPDLGDDVALFDVPHHHLPVEKDRKPEAEAKLLELLDGSCELIVLARYMQIRWRQPVSAGQGPGGSSWSAPPRIT